MPAVIPVFSASTTRFSSSARTGVARKSMNTGTSQRAIAFITTLPLAESPAPPQDAHRHERAGQNPEFFEIRTEAYSEDCSEWPLAGQIISSRIRNPAPDLDRELQRSIKRAPNPRSAVFGRGGHEPGFLEPSGEPTGATRGHRSERQRRPEERLRRYLPQGRSSPLRQVPSQRSRARLRMRPRPAVGLARRAGECSARC